MSYGSSHNLSEKTNDELVTSVCHALRDMRKEQSLSQEELSRRSGVDRVTISRTEKGRPASLLTVIQLLRGLGRLDLLNYWFNNDNITPNSPLAVKESDKKEQPKGEYPDW
ncbi:helix-turn-helix transcriptional regulator [candidate division KSB1 bacterium]|nr:helix-turn-helix transcriptional regulator [candidate division KSB1 bacterium]